jgi:hypothetical protein
MFDNFITDGAGSGGSLEKPLKLLEAARKKKIKKYVDRHRNRWLFNVHF